MPATAIAIQQPARPDPPVAEPAPALTDEQEARAQALEGRLKCPVCRVQSVRESGSFMALEMRAKIRELVAAGRSDEEVLDWFVARYGDYILLEPRKRGFGLAAWLLPLAAVGAGAILLILRARSRSRRWSRGAARGSAGAGLATNPTTSPNGASAVAPRSPTVVVDEATPGRGDLALSDLEAGPHASESKGSVPELSAEDRERVERELRRYLT